MFRINLRIIKKSDSLIILTPGYLFRILFAILCVALIIGLFFDPGDKVPILGIILILISIIGVLYEEKWSFDKEGRIIEYRFGLSIFFKKEIISFDHIDEFNYSDTAILQTNSSEGEHRRKPFGILSGRPVKYSVFSLITTDGKVRNIEVVKTRTSSDLAEKGKTIAAFCGYELKHI